MSRASWVCFLLLPMLIASGCRATHSRFERAAGDAASALAGAATALTYAHEGKIPGAYARSSLAQYRQQLQGLEQALPAQAGAPDPAVVKQLLDVYGPARGAVDSPCMNESCDWRGQVAALTSASAAFLQAGGG